MTHRNYISSNTINAWLAAVIMTLFFAAPIKGQNWVPKGYGAYSGVINTICVSNGNVIATTSYTGAFVSTDQGVTWRQTLHDTFNAPFGSVITFNSKVYLGSSSGLFVSTDDGLTWSASGFAGHYVFAIGSIGTTLLASADKTYYSNDGGTTWNASNASGLKSFSVVGSTVVAEDGNSHVYVSADNGVTWAKTATLDAGSTYSLAAAGSTLLAVSNIAAYRSVDGGTTWSVISSLGSSYYSVTSAAGVFYLGGSVLARSADGGITFQTVSSSASIQVVVTGGAKLYAAGWGSSLVSNDNGLTWQTFPGPAKKGITTVAAVGDTIITDAYRSTDNGISWSSFGPIASSGITKLSVIGKDFYASTSANGIFKSADGGVTWVACSSGLASLSINAFEIVDSTLVAATSAGIYVSQDYGTSWAATSMTSASFTAIAGNGSEILASGNFAGIYRSTDKGNTWSLITGSTGNSYNSLAVWHGKIYGGGYSGLMVSSDGGHSWSTFSLPNTSFGQPIVTAILAAGSMVFVATYDDGYFGITGNSLMKLFPLYTYGYSSFFYSGTTLFAGVNQNYFGSLWTLDLSTVTTFDSFSPTTGKVGSTVTITGSNFSTTSSRNTVSFNGYYGTVLSATPTTLQVAVPAAAGNFPLQLTVNNQTISSANSFAVIPEIKSISPAAAITGEAITISGYGFDPTARYLVSFNGGINQPYVASTTMMRIAVPDGATTGAVSVTGGTQPFSAPNIFTVIPVVSSAGPLQGAVGTTVYMGGSGFGTSKSNIIVKFNGTIATVQSLFSSQLTVLVPNGATSGPITIQVSGYTATGPDFIVTPVTSECFTMPAKPTIRVVSSESSDIVLQSSSRGGNHWFKDGVSITGAIDSVLDVTETGSYSVIVNIQGCVSPMSDAVVFTVTGDIHIGGDIAITPNPTRGEITLDLRSLAVAPVVIDVYTSMGRKASTMNAVGGGLLDTSLANFSDGVYILKVSQGQQVVSLKVVKY